MKQLLLLGAGQAHLQLLAQLARQPLAGTEVTLISPFDRTVRFAQLSAFVAGSQDLAGCTQHLAALVQASGVQWLQRSVTGLDARSRVVQLDDGSHWPYQLLSINTGPAHDRDRIEALMPGARHNALFVRPTEAFVELWPQVCAMAAKQSLRVAVIGGGAGGFELACAMAERLPTASVTLLSGHRGLLPHFSPAMRHAAQRALHQHHVSVIQARATAVQPGLLQLSNGASLSCDVPVVALGAQAPAWLTGSGLALDSQGFVLVDDCQRSSSHPHVLAAGDVCSRQDGQGQRNGYDAMQTGAALVANVRALAAGIDARSFPLRTPSLPMLSCGGRQAIAQWGRLTAQGYWVWLLKQQRQRAWLNRALKMTRA
jgi:NADH dehydrogenase FAD-containing subunit